MSLPTRGVCPAYPTLSALLGGDAGRVGVVVRVFHRSVTHDLRQMELALAAGHWTLVRQLAHRMASGCRQVGEDAVADALANVERASRDSSRENLSQAFEDARRDLIAVLGRAAAHIGIDVPESGVLA